MKNSLPIKLENNELVISTIDIASGLEVEHASVFKMVKKFDSELQSIRGFRISNPKTPSSEKGGRPVSFCFLNEEQSIFLVTLMKNSKIVVKFKMRLVKDFLAMRNKLQEIALRQKNSEWLAQRAAGKIIRKSETDAIKEFVEYAMNQGSQNANRYYCNISQMENKALFLLEQKFKNLRDILDLNQLATITTADAIVSKALKEGMNSRLNYKDIYQLAKNRVETLAELRGKTFIPATQQIGHQAQAQAIGM